MMHRLLMTTVALIFFCGGANTNAQEISESVLKGKWTLIYLDGWYCCSCPKIYFDSGGSGRTVFSPSKREEFRFILSENNIVFSFDDGNDFFGSLEFECELYWNDTHECLNLTTMDGNHEFTLIRGK